MTRGVAKLGHTGAHWGTSPIATGACAPPAQALLKIIGTECTVINRESGANYINVHKVVEIELRSIAIRI